MMAPFVYEEARAQAAIHVQLRHSGRLPSRTNAACLRVTGRVVRIFRDRDSALSWGQKVTFLVPIINPTAISPPMVGGTIHHPWERIGPSQYLETFLETWDGAFHLVHSQIVPIRRPTLHPVCGPDTQRDFSAKGTSSFGSAPRWPNETGASAPG